MEQWGTICVLVLVLGFFTIGIASGSTADWAFRKAYSSVDLTDKGGNKIGYRIVAPVSSPDDMNVSMSVKETRWSFNLGKAGTCSLIYLPAPAISDEDDFFEIYERDVSFYGYPFETDNLYYDGNTYSCWGKTGESGVQYDCARFIDGNFFCVSRVYSSLEEALRYNQVLREVIQSISKSPASEKNKQ